VQQLPAALFCLSEIESASQANDDDDSDGKLPVGHN